jgi:hypothetical protein
MPWRARLNDDPLPWLLEPDNPAVRYFSLTDLLDRPPDDREVAAAKSAINASHPVRAILEAQDPGGYWVKPGPGYSPKYRSTVWQLIFLDQLGADSSDARLRAGCEYVLAYSQAPNGGFGASGQLAERRPPNSTALHCLNGNLLRALLNFGYYDDERVRQSIEWQARSITGDRFDDYYKSGTASAGFGCGANGGQACAWGAIKALRALARVPASLQTPQVKKATRAGAAFLLSRDPAQADYPAGDGRVSGSWFRLGFPSGYVADVLQNLEVLAEVGHGRDRRLRPAIDWLLSKQDARGRWKNQYAYAGKLWADFEPQGSLSKWVTLRACRVLKAAAPAAAS